MSSPSPPALEELESRWAAEAIRLHRRYQVEVVDAYGLCPWAARAATDGKVRERVLLQRDEALLDPSLEVIDEWVGDASAQVTFIIYPGLALERLAFHDFAARVQAADARRYELGRVPFVFATFHPDAEPDTRDAERLIPFLRRTPDPTLQLLRASVLDDIRTGGSSGTQFIDIKTIEASISGGGLPPLRERIARTNLSTALGIGIDAMRQRFEDIQRDREESYRALAIR